MMLHKELVILYDSGFLSPTILSDKLTSYVIQSMLQASLKNPKKLQFLHRMCRNLCNSK
jgi:argonaute-like protein implicated in RNA metabolism and viral defense